MAFLERYREILDARYCTYSLTIQKAKGQWWKLVGARSSVPFCGEKIVFPARSKTLYFYYSNNPIYSSMDTYYIYSSKINMKFLAAYLNADVVLDYLKNNTKVKGEKYELYSEPVGEIPFPKFHLLKEYEELIDEIVGTYSTYEVGDGYQFHRETSTWIKKRGLFDVLIEIREKILVLLCERNLELEIDNKKIMEEFLKEQPMKNKSICDCYEAYCKIKSEIDRRIRIIWKQMEE